MPADLVFLHTSPVHVSRFTQLLQQADPDRAAAHVVDEALLADAQHQGADAPAIVQRVHAAMQAAAAAHAARLVVCTCSTIGGAAERTPTGGRFEAMRIDRAMADRAVRRGPRLLLVAALRSTLAPTRELIDESARALGVDVQPTEHLVAGAWPLFERGDTAAYLQTAAASVRQAMAAAAPQGFSAVVLAQASMAEAVPLLADLGTEVLASPPLGVQAIVAALRR
ncbi:Asp/Glu/hydantoin racemase [Aquabacterium sp.]|uniref:Asp/Glu/hydantoin racemase n=1 Tax=Aquabacterium sp. TaxID=1872578 RepID=UPI003785099E